MTKCLESILIQSYKQLEIILVDDGSTDDSYELCKKFAAQDSRIRVFHKTNGGVASARNVGLSFANGEYIGFVDGDDYIVPDMYQVLHDQLSKQNYSCVMCEHMAVNENGAGKNISFEGKQDSVSSEYACAGLCISIGTAYTDVKYFFLWDKLFKREIWRDIRFDETLRNGEDRWALFQLYRKMVTVQGSPRHSLSRACEHDAGVQNPIGVADSHGFCNLNCEGTDTEQLRTMNAIGLCHRILYFRLVHDDSTSASVNRNRDFDYDIGYRMLMMTEKTGGDLSPYLETCVMHSLGRARYLARKKDIEKYRDTHKEYKMLFKKAKKQIANAQTKYMLAAVAFRFFPNTLYRLLVHNKAQQ